MITTENKLDLIIHMLRGGCTCDPPGRNVQFINKRAVCTACGKTALPLHLAALLRGHDRSNTDE